MFVRPLRACEKEAEPDTNHNPSSKRRTALALFAAIESPRAKWGTSRFNQAAHQKQRDLVWYVVKHDQSHVRFGRLHVIKAGLKQRGYAAMRLSGLYLLRFEAPIPLDIAKAEENKRTPQHFKDIPAGVHRPDLCTLQPFIHLIFFYSPATRSGEPSGGRSSLPEASL